MKRLYVILMMVAIAGMTFGQVKTINGKTLTIYKALAPTEWSYEYTPASTERISPNKYDTINLVVMANKAELVNPSGYVGVSSRVGTTDTYAFIIGGKFQASAANTVLESYTSQTASAILIDTSLVKSGTAPFLVHYNERPHRYFSITIANDNSQNSADSLMLSKIVIRLAPVSVDIK